MLIETKYLGQIEILHDSIIIFEEGLLGLEELKKYVLIDADSHGLLKCLQSVEDKNISFIVVSPWDVLKEYEMDVDEEELDKLKDKDMNNLLAYSILTIGEDKMTANLMGPVMINIKTRRGKQIVLHKSQYTTKHIIKEFIMREE